MLVTFNDVSIKYVDKVILNNASFTINENDKIGVVGINGTGKSTLLKLIIGEVEKDSGTIFRKSNLQISYLPQSPLFENENTIFQVAKKLSCIDKDYEIKSMLSKFGLDEYDKKIMFLSGGEKRRLSLAIALLKPCELLILDEPTNHLDIWMINWLEKFLLKWNKGLLLVTHDRYFLERITNRTLEIEQGSLYLYDTNYSEFLKLKAERLESQIATTRKLTSLLKKEAIWASLNPQARSTKSKERLMRFEALEKEVNDKNNTINEINKEFRFSSNYSRLGKKTIIIDNISKTIDGKTLFNDFSYNIRRLDRLGIVGENGSGKSTLFKAILGQISADSGSIVIGETVRVGYLKQEDEILNKNIRIIDYLKSFAEEVNYEGTSISVSNLLEDFFFTKNMQYMPISSLSGGEKRRLQLLTVLIQNPNILFLDEPTNDLDIYTLEVLEDYLENFKGAVIVISHDRYFLDKVCNHSFIYNKGKLTEYTGLITDYITEAVLNKKEKITYNNEKKDVDIPRFTSKEKKEFDQIESLIYEQEEKIKKLTDETYITGTDYQRVIELNNEIEQENVKLNYLYERYEYLNNINDQIELYKKEKFKYE